MVPAGFVDETIEKLAAVLEPDDTVIDGGNSFYQDDIRRAKELGERTSTTSTWAPAAASSASTAATA